MANNYLQFSEGIDHISPEERDWMEQKLDPARCATAEPPGLVRTVGEDEFSFEWLFQAESPDGELRQGESYFWVYAEEWGDPVQVGHFVQAFLAKFRPDDFFVLTYAESCSKPRIGEFAGGAILVTKDECRQMDAYGWAEDQVRGLLSARPKTGAASTTSTPVHPQ